MHYGSVLTLQLWHKFQEVLCEHGRVVPIDPLLLVLHFMLVSLGQVDVLLVGVFHTLNLAFKLLFKLISDSVNLCINQVEMAIDALNLGLFVVDDSLETWV